MLGGAVSEDALRLVGPAGRCRATSSDRCWRSHSSAVRQALCSARSRRIPGLGDRLRRWRWQRDATLTRHPTEACRNDGASARRPERCRQHRGAVELAGAIHRHRVRRRDHRWGLHKWALECTSATTSSPRRSSCLRKAGPAQGDVRDRCPQCRAQVMRAGISRPGRTTHRSISPTRGPRSSTSTLRCRCFVRFTGSCVQGDLSSCELWPF